jgi:hypothetical protein
VGGNVAGGVGQLGEIAERLVLMGGDVAQANAVATARGFDPNTGRLQSVKAGKAFGPTQPAPEVRDQT